MAQKASSQGSFREIVHVAWPLIVGMLSFTAMGLADTLFVGRLGMTELAGVGLAVTVFFLVNSFFRMTLRGVGIVTSQADGAGDKDRALASAWQGIYAGIFFGFIVVFTGFFSQQIFALIGGEPKVLAFADEFFRVRVFAGPIWFIAVPIHAYFNGLGQTKLVMKFTLLANILNIILDPIFIFGFGPIPAMGVVGAAWATVLAFAISTLVTVTFFLRKKGWYPTWKPDILKKVFELGVPIGIRATMGMLGWTIVTGMISRMGEAELAAHQIAIRIVSVSFLPGYGISEAASILVGRYMGAEKPLLAQKAYKNSLRFAFIVMGIFGIIFIAMPEMLLVAFKPSAEVVFIGTKLLQIAAFFQIADAISMVSTGALNGASDTKITSVVSIAATWLILIPIAYFLGIYSQFGINGIWFAMVFEVFIMALILGVRAHFILNGKTIPLQIRKKLEKAA